LSQSISQAILEATKVLSVADIAEARRDAGSLLANLLGQDRTFLITHPETVLSDEQLTTFRKRVVRRAGGEPLQYITGIQEFYGLTFEVNPDALIPRPETELLVETALSMTAEDARPLILDIGTGSGCISIAFLHNRPRARSISLDLSAAAVRLAARNATRHSVRERMQLVVSDSVSAIKAELRFDLIVSNPPYISDPDWQKLTREVKDHEPRLALTSGFDGLTMINDLLVEAPYLLRTGGHFIFEIGYAQSVAVEQNVDRRVWEIVSIRTDLQQIPRTFTLKKR
jgi:release factor glutamine methyltransferase